MLYLEISKKVNRRKQRLMAPDFVYFYVFAFLMISSALGIIFAPRMYLSLLSLFFLVVFSSLLYLGLNAVYLSVFQFILCGLCLFVYVFLLLKKIGRLNLSLKLVKLAKIVMSSFFILLFGICACIFFIKEFSNSLFEIFNSVAEKSSDVVNFGMHVFPLHLILLLVLVSAVVIRVFLLASQNNNAQPDEDIIEGDSK